MHVFGTGRRPSQNDGLTGLCSRLSFVGTGHDDAASDARACAFATRDHLGIVQLSVGQTRRQDQPHLFGRDAVERGFLANCTFARHVDGDAYRGGRRPFGRTALQQEKLALLHRKLDILDIAILALKRRRRRHQGFVSPGDAGLHRLQRIGGKLARDDIFALCAGKILAKRLNIARRRVSAEQHSRAAAVIQIAEHHGLHGHGGSQIVWNAVMLAVTLGAA